MVCNSEKRLIIILRTFFGTNMRNTNKTNSPMNKTYTAVGQAKYGQ